MYSCATLDILTMQSRVRVVGWLRQWTTCGREPATRSPHPVTRAMIHHHHLLVMMRMTIREANSEVVQKGGGEGSSFCMIKLNCKCLLAQNSHKIDIKDEEYEMWLYQHQIVTKAI